MHRRHTHHQKPYSPKKVVKPISFMFMGEAQSVFVIGDFNDWDPGAHPMKQGVDGAWRVEIPIAHGHHHYLLIVDDKPMLDPRALGIARNESGEKVSLLGVS
ncbi:MAG TPA: isoamylase early set domain-containing protein [Candidatus Binatia bacterium]|nr:isoamylase early set domain-containing protein [Candidatus Binatia bacterium]